MGKKITIKFQTNRWNDKIILVENIKSCIIISTSRLTTILEMNKWDRNGLCGNYIK